MVMEVCYCGEIPLQTRLLHVRTNVSDLPRAVKWYTEILGFEVHEYWPPENPDYVDFVVSEGATFSVMAAKPVPTGGRYNFRTSNVEDLWNELKNKVDIVEPLFDTAYGTRKFTIRDPDGNELGFVQE